ncbi:SpaA isopeptide-forming pilin-related protein [Paenibacillus sp. D2_2]|uniref:SpaA isopeptide-forming pilin-related protein n=1 Tax=Paenibacillus sp. D2_2 TaxID=3073092 RepID=UPI002815EB33|nr:SpaA isopeptide-forming pilin-related protein [Paenibacillus sp. D2_2]WMT41384.1 SpaA isopeptide-forming pilin-related protein [Paenibacillus sp. D2_2]
MNNATLDWVETIKTIDTNKTLTDVAYADPDSYTTDNGNKTGKYNAGTKEITWTIDVNYNRHTIPNAVIQDTFTREQTFDKASVEVYQLNIGDSGNNNVSQGPSVDPSLYDVDYIYDNNEIIGFELKFKNEIKTAYQITYITSLEGHPVKKKYSNTAVMFNEEASNNLFNKSVDVEIPHGDEYVNKKGYQGKDANEDFAYWTVHINNSQSTIAAESVLTDTLSSNQELLQNSFKLYTTDSEGKLNKKDEVPETDYTLTFDENNKNTFTLTFLNEISRAYILEYTSFINVKKNGDKISNDAKFAGHSSGTVNNSDKADFAVVISGLQAGATIPKGDLTIEKVDAKTGALLEGATFELYDETGKTLIQTLKTGDDGQVVFKNLRYKKYMLRENAAPDGYIIDPNYKAGKVIDFKASTPIMPIKNTKGVWDFELTKIDSETKLPLEGAHFKLQILEGTGYVDVPEYSDMITIFGGTISYKGLEKGRKYRVFETEAPQGYQLDPKPHEFTIDENQDKAKTYEFVNEINKGLVELLKTDEFNGTPLAGIVFKLQDLAGKLVKDGYYTTDQDGKISVSDLRAGKYQFIEDETLPDYILDQSPIDFEIVDDGVTVNVSMTNKQIPGSVKLTKIENGQPSIKLQGAQFSILDEENNVVIDQNGHELKGLTTDKDGQIIVTDLRPGKYYFEETLAPNNYKIKTELTEFEIVKNEETDVTIENDPYLGSVELLKTDEFSGDPLVGVRFEIQDLDGNLIQNGHYTTDQDGKILISGLKVGKYQFIEEEALLDYILDQTPTEFEIVHDGVTVKVSMTNKQIPDP